MGRLLEAAVSSKPNTGGVRSTLDVWLDTLNDEDRTDALGVLNDMKFGHAFVSALIKQVHGKSFTDGVVRTWRVSNGVC